MRPALLAAWLFGLGLPMGALALALAAEALGLPETGPLPMLRRMARLLPVAALCGIPVLWLSAGLMGGAAGTGRGWWAPAPFAAREAAALAGLSLLSLGFAPSPRRGRRPAAIGAAFVFLLLATLGATDWWLGPQPALGSSLVGLLLVVSQAGSAGCAACLAQPRGGAANPSFGVALGLLFAAWAGLHFIQFLVAWSANLPDEAAWYLARISGLGGWVVGYGGLAALAVLALAPPCGGTRALAWLAAAGLFAHLLECWWFVIPAARGGLRPNSWDGAAMALAAGLVALGLWRGRRAAA